MTLLEDVGEHDQPDPEGWRSGVGVCPLVLGECVQGHLRGGPHFLITAPLPLESRAEFVADLSLGQVVTEPARCTKSRAAVERYFESQGLPVSGRLRVHTGAQSSVGFGTSTADITASLRAAAAAWGRTLSPAAISQIAIDIEPTDGSMYPGSVAYAHREGRLLESFGPLPRFRALVVLCGEDVDTVAFDAQRAHFRYSAEAEQRLLTAWRMVREAIRSADVRLMAQAGMISAEINQELLPKPLFAEIRGVVESLGAAGLLAAHSGSLLGVVLDPDAADCLERRDRIARFLEDLGLTSWQEIASY
jgi:L-threonine kinase